MRSTVESTTIDLDDDAVDRAAAETAAASIPDGDRGIHPVTVQLPVYVDVNGARHELGTVRTELTLGVAEEWFRSPEAAAARIGVIPPGPARAPDPEAVDALDAERAARVQQRAAGDVGIAEPARTVESTLRDITAYECAQEAAAALRGQFLPQSGPDVAAVANAWLSLGLSMATHDNLNKPDKAEGAR